MSYCIKTFKFTSHEGYMDHDRYYIQAMEWIQERYGSLSKKFEFNSDGCMDYIGRYGANWCGSPLSGWEDVKELFWSNVPGLELPYSLDYLGKIMNDQVVLWDTERCKPSDGIHGMAERLVHDIIVILPSDVDAVEFKLVVG